MFARLLQRLRGETAWSDAVPASSAGVQAGSPQPVHFVDEDLDSVWWRYA